MTIPKLEFPPFELPPEAEVLREEVCAFLEETLPGIQSDGRSTSWTTHSVEFSRALGAHGWLPVIDGIAQPAPTPRFVGTPSPTLRPPRRPGTDNVLPRWGIDSATMEKLRSLKPLQ